MLTSTAGALQAPVSYEYLIEVQPFSSCINTLLRVISANNALQKASTGTRTGKFLPQLLLTLWLKAGGRLPAPPPVPDLPRCPPRGLGWTRATHSPKSWALRGTCQVGEGGGAATTSQSIPGHREEGGVGGSSLLLLVSLWACQDAAGAKRGTCGFRSQVVHVQRWQGRQGPGGGEPSPRLQQGKAGTGGAATGNPSSQAQESSGGKASRVEIKRCFWELA